jgi:hypothetical protein
MSQNIIKSAKLFSRNPIRKKTLEDVVNDSLYRINALIESASKGNKTRVVYRLPVSFAIPESIREDEFRLEVYFTIVNILETKGYKVNIRMGDESFLYVSWNVEKADVRQWMSKLSSLSV